MKGKAFRFLWQMLPFAAIIFGIFVALGGIFCAIFGQTEFFERPSLQLLGLFYGFISGLAASIMAFRAVSKKIPFAEFAAYGFFLTLAWVGASFGILLCNAQYFWSFTGAGLLGIAIGACFFPLLLLYAVPAIIIRKLH